MHYNTVKVAVDRLSVANAFKEDASSVLLKEVQRLVMSTGASQCTKRHKGDTKSFAIIQVKQTTALRRSSVAITSCKGRQSGLCADFQTGESSSTTHPSARTLIRRFHQLHQQLIRSDMGLPQAH